MTVALRRPMTLDEFLAWERGQGLRYEFDGVQPIAMTGGTVAHSVIGSNLFSALDAWLRDPCRAFRSDLKIIVANQVRYPDAIVTCSPVADDADIVPNPVVVAEVLSVSTAGVDRTSKAAEYQATSSIQHYLMLEQARAEVLVLSRVGDGWVEERVTGLDAIISLPAVGTSLPMSEIYRRVRMGS